MKRLSKEQILMLHSQLIEQTGRIDGYSGAYGSGNNVMTGRTIFSAINVNRYICCSCGFIEEWIDKEDIDKVENSKKAKREI